ncbi:VanZ family protein [Flavicella sp.]|uniref:VanZ family protein n=1 Tax=Flavicella sp. TaxID=2957742 RepID=UPI00262F7CF7|nr:VanZ family protein [Flavicella sp.]MDG1804691.1 VanZ family protein [Flavicella sp.]
MLALIKNLYKANAVSIAVSLTAIVAYLSLSKISSITPVIKIDNVDKYQHSLAYFGLTLSWLFAAQKIKTKPSFKFWMVFFVFLFGVLMEILQQELTTYRTADFFDVLANTSGIIIAYVFFQKVVFRRFKDFLKD